MRAIALLAAVWLGILAPEAAQTAPANSGWTTSGERVMFEPAKISAPRQAAVVESFETTEFSHKGEGVDSAITYRSADQKIVATLYVYYPSLGHSGVQAIATDQAIRSARSPGSRLVDTGVAPVAGKPLVAVTASYDHYVGENHTKSAVIKAGRWMVKLRVTGPETRSGEVASVMKALLDGLRFEGQAQPEPAAPISAAPCAPSDRPDAARLPTDAEAAKIALLDGAGGPVAQAATGGKKPAPARIGRAWCQTVVEMRDVKIAALQAAGVDRPARGLPHASALLVLFNDAGGILEVVRLGDGPRHLLLQHGIAEVVVVESYDGLPSLAQIGRLFLQPVQVHTRIKLNPDGSTKVELPAKQQ